MARESSVLIRARTILINHLGKIPLGWFSKTSSAEVKQGATDDVLNMHQSIGHAPVDVTTTILSPTLPFVYLFAVDWRMALVLLAYLVAVLGVAAPFMFRDLSDLEARYNASLVELSAAVVEMVEGISVIKTFGSTSRAGRRFSKAVANLSKICYVWTRKSGGPAAIIFALFSPASLLVMLLAVTLWFLSCGWTSLPACIPFLVLGVGIPSSLINLFVTVRFLQQSLVAAGHLGSILAVQPLEEPREPRTVTADGLTVAFDDVSFSYGKDASPALQEVSATLEPDTVVALVGASGSGKTTFARLIPRFWDPVRGRVTINEVGLREMMTSYVLSKVAIVFQDTIILRESIKNNIRLARPDASDEEVVAAAKGAQIHERIKELPHGYDTVIGGPAVRRRAAARGHRPRHAARCANPGSRRGHRACRSGKRNRHPRGPFKPRAGKNHRGHRPSSQHHRPCRSDTRPERRQDYRARTSRRARGQRGSLRRPLGVPAD